MSEHTPGPWEIRDIFTGHGPVLLDDRSQVIAAFDWIEPNEPDARLIAAAPDLLAALEVVSKRLHIEAEEKGDELFPCRALIDDIDAAIAKCSP